MRMVGKLLLYLNAATAMAFGLRYITATTLMPYHIEFMAGSGSGNFSRQWSGCSCCFTR